MSTTAAPSTPSSSGSGPGSRYKEYRQDIVDYADLFEGRNRDWQNIISQAELAQKSHQATGAVLAQNLAVAKTTHSASEDALEILDKSFRNRTDRDKFDSSGSFAGNLYKDQKYLRDIVNNPYKDSAFVSNFASSKRAGLIWPYKNPLDVAAEMMRNGKHEKAQKYLSRADSLWRNPSNLIRLMRMGFSEYKTWKSDLKTAAQQIPEHRKNYLGLKSIDQSVDYHETKTAETLRRLLKDRDVSRMLRLMPDPGPHTDPALAALIRHAKEPRGYLARLTNTGYPSVKEFKAQIRTQAADALSKGSSAGFIDPQSLRHKISDINLQSKSDIFRHRAESKAQEKRIDAVNEFIKSCKTTQQRETKISYLVDGMCRDMTAKIRGIANAGDHADDLTVVRTRNMAYNKSLRWTSITDAQEQCNLIKKSAFNPDDIGRLPHRQYMLNSTTRSIGRGADFAYTYTGTKFVFDRLSSAFKSSSEKPATPTPTKEPTTLLSRLWRRGGSGGGKAPEVPPVLATASHKPNIS